MFCPKCGTKNPDGALFCGACGNTMASTANQAQQPQQAQQVPQAQRGSYQQPGAYVAPMGGAAASPKRKLPIIPIAIVAAVIVVLIVGFSTSWFGLTAEKVFVYTEATSTSTSLSSHITTKRVSSIVRDGQGNIVEMTVTSEGSSSGAATTKATYTRDKDGYVTLVSVSGSETYLFSRLNTLDEKGRIASAVITSSGISVPVISMSFEYYGNTDTLSAIVYHVDSLDFIPADLGPLAGFVDLAPGFSSALGPLSNESGECRLACNEEGIIVSANGQSIISDPRTVSREQRKGQTIVIEPSSSMRTTIVYDSDGNHIHTEQESSGSIIYTYDRQWTSVSNPSRNVRIFKNIGV